jgi:transcriptional regulator with XRE-family HTH domain
MTTNLRTIRRSRGLNLNQVATLTECHYSFLSYIERRKRRVGLRLAATLALLFGVAVDELFDEEMRARC